MNPLEALHLQLRLEGKEIIRDNLLRQVAVVPDEEVPLLLIAQLVDEDQAVVCYADESLQTEMRKELTKLISEFSFPNIDPLARFLQRRKIAFEFEHYKTYIFPKEYSSFKDENVKHYSKHDPKIEGFDAERSHAIEQNDKILSTCVSSRENEFCSEAWVYTLPKYRNRGYAQKVVSAWAASVLVAGKIPFYSHKIQNIASSNLAKRLKLQPVFEEIVISKYAK